MTAMTLEVILGNISLPAGWTVRTQAKGDGWNVQILFVAPDAQTGVQKMQHCRKWYVSSWATHSEVVRTVYKAGLAALEHEFDETFRYRGVAIYDPHLDVEDMVENTRTSTDRDVRPEPSTDGSRQAD
jgi:hypothetical protein